MSQPSTYERPFFAKPSVIVALFTAGALFILTGYLLWTYLPDPKDEYKKLVTPVGDDFFSTEFLKGDEAIGAYVITVNVGSDESTAVTTLLDTGSAQTWFKASTNVAMSSSTFKAFPDSPYSTSYMGGDVRGYEAQDLVDINGYQWEQRFGFPTSGSMLNALGKVDGLVGLSRGGCSATELCSHANWPLKESLFSFYYDPASWHGVFTAGFVDETQYCDGPMHYVKQTGNYFWTATISGFYVNGQRIAKDIQGVFDTGTTYLHMKSTLYDRIFNEVLTSISDCLNPEFMLEINGRNFTIPADVLKKNTGASFPSCGLRVDAYKSGTALSDSLLVGAVFLVNYYTVFDLANDRIGFCQPTVGLSLNGRRLEAEDDEPVISQDERVSRISKLLDHRTPATLPRFHV